MTLLREALAARPDGDFMVAAPARRRSPAKVKKVGAGARLLSFALRHPREIVVSLLLTGCGGAIAWNALVLQTARHPAPLFNQQNPAPQLARPLPPTRPAPPAPEAPAQAAVQPSSLAPAVAPAPAAPKLPSRGAIVDLIRNGGDAAQSLAAQSQASQPQAPQPPVRAASAPPAASAAPSKAPAMRDPIGEIIRMGGPVPTPPANVGKAEPGDLILAGQRALAKLGYGIKADGLMGTGTRQAIERFEQERHLPVTGEFGARTARELSAASGIAVQ
jgi:peptidoglycan hydrolase-like protein with peptidoglycan-binding domain